MIPKFYIIGSETKRPSSRKTIFTDGSPDQTFRENTDIELSHWIPNRTAKQYRADTSTEICMRFIEDEAPGDWDLAINNHLDIDGILSVFSLVHSEIAKKHKQTIIEAAEMGDFWAWGSESSQILFQGLTLFMNNLQQDLLDIQDIYAQSFNKTIELLESRVHDKIIQNGIISLAQSYERVQSGAITRVELGKRFVHYHLPASLTASDRSKALKIPGFNDLLQDDMWLYPQVRNKLDKEKIQLVSAETDEGTYYDLWYPGYMWADTPHSWRAPGFSFAGSTNAYYYGYAPLSDAVEELRRLETGGGTWKLVKQLTPFSSIQGRNYPVVLSCMNDQDEPQKSKIPKAEVAYILARAFV